MKYFSLFDDKVVTNLYLTRLNSKVWVYAGIYPIIRQFDEDRWLIDCGRNADRALTVIAKNLGEVTDAPF